MSAKIGIDSILRFATEVDSVPAGQTIFNEGDAGDVMYVVKEGEVDVHVRHNIAEVVGPGGIVGEMALIDRGPRSATAIARTDCLLVRVSEARFRFLVQQVPAFSLEVMATMARRLRKVNTAG